LSITSTRQNLTPYIPSPEEVIFEMLRLAGLRENETLIDLGCGDGRIPIIAAKYFGANAVGIEVRDVLVNEAIRRVEEEGLRHKVKILHEDMFKARIDYADVLTLYQTYEVNLMLVSLDYEVPTLPLVKKLETFKPARSIIYLYIT